MKAHLSTLMVVICLTSFVYGEKKGSMLGFNPTFSAGEDPATQYQSMTGTFKAGWVRLWELDWSWQGNPNDYAPFLKKSTLAKQYGLKVLAICIGAPTSKSGSGGPNDDKYPPYPQFYGEFAQYCAGFVRNGADAVEVWNEPNLDGFWTPKVNLTSHEQLAGMIKAVYPAVKAVNSSAIVVVGGVNIGADIYATDNNSLAHAGLHYLERLFTVPGFANSFDAMGLHPYAYGGGHPDTGLYQFNLWRQVPAVVELVRRNSGPKPLWFTEFGAPSNYYGCSLNSQLIDYQQYMAGLDNWMTNNASMIGVSFIWQLIDRSEAQFQNDKEGYFGIMYSNFSMKPSGLVVKNWANQDLPVVPTPQPTVVPTPQPTVVPTPQPPTPTPPTPTPTRAPTPQPTSTPTLQPTSPPTLQPTSPPTLQPTSTPTLQPTTNPCIPTNARGNGLLGHYYADPGWWTLKGTQVDPNINYNWGNGGPSFLGGQVDSFSIIWTGFVQPRFSGLYTFYVTSDDGARLYVDGQLVVNVWYDRALTETAGTINLVQGRNYTISYQYYDNTGDAAVYLFWSSSCEPRTIVPQAQLFAA